MLVKEITRKSMIIRNSGRSSDYITPSFGYGCLLNCSYCYMKRHLPKGLNYAKNINQILTEVNNHAMFDTVEKPNQTDPKYITYDISCNEDFALHSKYYDWEKIFDFFKYHPVAKATLATKIIPTNLLGYNSNNKVRIRFSLMPQKLSSILEPNTPDIIDRIKAVDRFIKAGYEIHLNFSPVIVYKGWLEDYENLFKLVNQYISNKDLVKCEVIFLTHNESKHVSNLMNNNRGEDLLWNPDIQENKTSEYGGLNVRYKRELKSLYIYEFKRLHKEIIPWNKIRYIF